VSTLASALKHVKQCFVFLQKKICTHFTSRKVDNRKVSLWGNFQSGVKPIPPGVQLLYPGLLNLDNPLLKTHHNSLYKTFIHPTLKKQDRSFEQLLTESPDLLFLVLNHHGSDPVHGIFSFRKEKAFSSISAISLYLPEAIFIFSFMLSIFFISLNIKPISVNFFPET